MSREPSSLQASSLLVGVPSHAEREEPLRLEQGPQVSTLNSCLSFSPVATMLQESIPSFSQPARGKPLYSAENAWKIPQNS